MGPKISSWTSGLVEICIIKDDVWALPTNLLNTVVLADGLADGQPVSDNEVEDTRREAGFTEHVGHHESGQGSQLGGLHDDGVSGCESGANLPGPHQDCESKGIR